MIGFLEHYLLAGLVHNLFFPPFLVIFHCHFSQGSMTGAHLAITKTVSPSFVLLAIKENTAVCYVYEYVNGEVDVSKTEFTKKIEEPL